MKVLFVYSGNSRMGQNKTVETQAKSLTSSSLDIELYPIIGKGFWGYLRGIKELSKHIRKREYDLIHAHYGLSGLAAFFSKKNEPLVVSFMGSDLIASKSASYLKNFIDKILIILNILFARFYYSFTLVKSDEMAKKLLKGTSFKKIPNGVCLENYFYIEQGTARQKLGIDNSHKIALFVSDPSRPEKNYSLALMASELINENKVNVMPIFNKSAKDLALYYNSADFLLLTSFHEGSPNVVKEAMACCCPVVSTNVGDIEWLFGNCPGHYISNFEPKEIAEKISLAIEYRENYGKTGGENRILELELDSDNIARKINAVYTGVVRSSN